MSNEIFEQFNKLSADAYANMQELASINTKVFEELSGKQQALFKELVESATAQAKEASGAGSYQEVVAAQAKYLSDTSEKVLASAKDMSDTLAKAREELESWVEKVTEATVEATKAA